ncbi:MAG: hypothetical protein R3D05_12885 [Dongiaceae bacterium]
MGADYEKAKARREQKAWRDGLDKLKQPGLYDRIPPDPKRIVRLSGQPQCALRVGESLVLEKRGQQLVAFSGLARVGESSDVSESIGRAVEQSHGMATGRVCSIDRRTGSLEIAIDAGTESLTGKST